MLVLLSISAAITFEVYLCASFKYILPNVNFLKHALLAYTNVTYIVFSHFQSSAVFEIKRLFMAFLEEILLLVDTGCLGRYCNQNLTFRNCIGSIAKKCYIERERNVIPGSQVNKIPFFMTGGFATTSLCASFDFCIISLTGSSPHWKLKIKRINIY